MDAIPASIDRSKGMNTGIRQVPWTSLDFTGVGMPRQDGSQ